MKLLFMGDIHIRGNNPRNRIDDYKEACKLKLYEVWQIAAVNKVEAILQPGDIFHSPEVAISTLLEFAKVFKDAPCPIYCTIGNHDVYGYNLDTFGRTSLQLLELLVPNFHVIQISQDIRKHNPEPNSLDDTVHVGFNPYRTDIDTSPVGYQMCEYEQLTNILVVHGMLLDHELPYEGRSTNLYHVDTNAKIILSGHDHTGFGVIKRHDGKLFCNPGALMRISASQAEIDRTIQVAIIDTAAEEISLVPLKCAKPGDEVLDRSKIVENQERQYAMEEFTALIQADGKAVKLNIPDIIDQISKQEKIQQNVIDKTLELIGSVQAC